MKILLKGISCANEFTNKLEILSLDEFKNIDIYRISFIKQKIIDNFKKSSLLLENGDFAIFSNGKFLSEENFIKFSNNQILEIKQLLPGGKVIYK